MSAASSSSSSPLKWFDSVDQWRVAAAAAQAVTRELHLEVEPLPRKPIDATGDRSVEVHELIELRGAKLLAGRTSQDARTRLDITPTVYNLRAFAAHVHHSGSTNNAANFTVTVTFDETKELPKLPAESKKLPAATKWVTFVSTRAIANVCFHDNDVPLALDAFELGRGDAVPPPPMPSTATAASPPPTSLPPVWKRNPTAPGRIVFDLKAVDTPQHVSDHWPVKSFPKLRVYQGDEVFSAQMNTFLKHKQLAGTDVALFDVMRVIGTKEEVYFIGGSIRDFLCPETKNAAVQIKDIDIAFTMPPEDLAKLCKENGIPIRARADNPYITLGDSKEADSKTSYHIEGLHALKAAHAPLYRADVRMNSILYDVVHKLIIDKSGEALFDIDAKLLRLPFAMSDTEARNEWVSDASKVCRYFKFLARDWKPLSEERKFVTHFLLHMLNTSPLDKTSSRHNSLNTAVSKLVDRKVRETSQAAVLVAKYHEVFMQLFAELGLKTAEAEELWKTQIQCQFDFKVSAAVPVATTATATATSAASSSSSAPAAAGSNTAK